MANMMSNECVFSTLTAGRVVLSQIEETLFAAIAALTINVFFTHTSTAQSVTQPTALRTSRVTVTC